jgi:hypothetical protein
LAPGLASGRRTILDKRLAEMTEILMAEERKLQRVVTNLQLRAQSEGLPHRSWRLAQRLAGTV